MSAGPITAVVVQQPPPSSSSSSSSSNVPFNSVISKQQQCSDAGDKITIETTSKKASCEVLSTVLKAFSTSTSTSTSSYDSEEEERNRQLIPNSEDSALGADSYDDSDSVEEQNELYSNLGTSSQQTSLSVSSTQSIINTNRNALETVTASSLPKTILFSSAISAITSNNSTSTSSEDHVIPPLAASPSSSSPPYASMSAGRAVTAICSKSLTKSSLDAHNHRHLHHQQSSVNWSSAAATLAKSATNTAISSFRSKSVSTSSSTSSGCGEDLDQLVNSPEDQGSDHDHHHHHHDSSPDSPDSGVSSSANSADDLKNTEGDEDEEEMHQQDETDIFQSTSSLKVVNSASVKSRSKSLRSGSHHTLSSSTSSAISLDIVHQKLQQTAATVNSMKGTKKSSTSEEAPIINSNSAELSALIPEAACKWHKCDWPGSYEELEDHILELHITLQPYYDENGKVIRWTKPPKKRANANNNFGAIDEIDETPCNSEPEDGSEDEPADSDDDTRSVSSASSMRITRRTGRLLADYSASGANKQQQQHKMTRQSSLGSSSSTKDAVKQTSSGMEFVCLWEGCRVYGVQSSKQWLERHVREYHMGPNLHKCILAGCTRRFKSQNALQKHLETAHFSNPNGSGSTTSGGALNQKQHHHHHHHNLYPFQEHNFDQLNSIFGEGSRAQHAKKKICCACACHSTCMCIICDSDNAPSATTVTSTETVTMAEQQHQQQKEKEQQRLLRHRPSTSRCESTDSAISLNSHGSTAEHCLPSTSTTSLSSSSSSSTASTSSSSSSPEHQQHSDECCKFNPSAALLKSRRKLLRRKKFFTPVPRPNTKFDFFGEQAAEMAIYAARQKRLKAAGIKYIYRMMKRLDDGTFVEIDSEEEEDDSSSEEEEELSSEVNDEFKEYMSEDESNDSDEDSEYGDDSNEEENEEEEEKNRIYYCIDERLFSKSITFISKVISTQKSSSGETSFQLRWHPKGFFEDEWIKKCNHEYYRTRIVPQNVLPKSFLQSLAEQFASQAAATVSNDTNTNKIDRADRPPKTIKKKGRKHKSKNKRSHSFTRNGGTVALGAEKRKNDDEPIAPSSPKRVKRLRRKP